MQKFIRIFGAIALTGLCVWGWFTFFPSPEKAIRSRLNKLAETISFEPQSGVISRAYQTEKAAAFFTTEAEVQVEVRGMDPQHLGGRDEIQQALLLANRSLRGFKVQFLDINVTLGADQQTAKANLTGKWTIGNSRDFDVLEFNFLLRKVDGVWLIYRVESVKTLSLKTSPTA